VGFKPTILMFELAKTVHALNSTIMDILHVARQVLLAHTKYYPVHIYGGGNGFNRMLCREKEYMFYTQYTFSVSLISFEIIKQE
jgi:hypothetical protein